MSNQSTEHFGYMRIVEVFDNSETANSFLREDGEGGFSSGVWRMAEEIDKLRATIAEQAERIATLEQTVEKLKENLESARITSDRQECHVIDGLRRISELEAALGEAVEALEPFAKTAEQIDEVGNHAQVAADDDVLCGGFKLSLPMIYLRKAKAVREKIRGVMQPSGNAETKGSDALRLPNDQSDDGEGR